MVKRIINVLCLVLFLGLFAKAQLTESFVHKGELGVSVGLGHYFGDMTENNYKAALKKPKFAAGVFYQKQITNYAGFRISGNYAFLGYSDQYNTGNYYKIRNLSFNTDIWELNVSGSFNFFRFVPGFKQYNFTPYVNLGLGVFSYDPYTYLGGEKYYLRSIGTEGQGSLAYPNLKPYSAVALCVPFTFGMKYSLNERMNLFGEFVYRFTNTDYIDDVSTVYAGSAAFPNDTNGQPSIGYLLQDRSYEVGQTLGQKGFQRGNSKQKDSYATFQIGISFNLQSYRCPTAN